ncbi:hypothetical protein B0293_01035 [Amycolatopsis azurea DSM 43854]|uniref:Uncharacterized protein n=1 Tax=Amycolatopsis azurea DSM 43854 TaxID=1238180 RepID=M2QBM3_9PSEU|nr:hypothetical protein C791_7137 [Amycolatopsis azurea DSM 43854]OOC08832.1 hypothetical protein B0293_01035 [Amycolatopsis azurea DSM 43854]
MKSRGDSAAAAAEGLRAIDTGAWEGPAGQAFHEKFSYEPNKWFDAADALHRANELVVGFAGTLQWAQGQAREAIAAWDRAQQVSQRAKAEHEAAAKAAAENQQPIPPFSDPGEAGRQAARDILNAARAQLDSAGTSVSGFLNGEAEGAPQSSSWLDDAGNFLADMGGHAVNALASFGNAMLNNPADVALAAAGAGLTYISAAGEGLGIALDATGIGAVAGVPLNAVSAAGMAVGGTMVVGAVGDLAKHAMTDDKATPVKARTSPSKPTKTDRMKEHLTEKDLDGAKRELNGEVVARKSSGQPWDHVDEVSNAQKGLVNQINRLKRQLGDSRLSAEDRPGIEAELSEASKILDYTVQRVGRLWDR